MRKKAYVRIPLLAVGYCFLALSPLYAQRNLALVDRQVLSPSVEVRVNPKECCGSGTVLKLNDTIYVLTCFHVVEDAKVQTSIVYRGLGGIRVKLVECEWQPVYVIQRQGDVIRQVPADVVFWTVCEEEEGHDLALLKPRDQTGFTPAKLACSAYEVKTAQKVYYVGCSASLPLVLEQSVVCRVNYKPDDLGENRYTMTSGSAWFGVSGGGLFVCQEHNYVLSGVMCRITNPSKSPKAFGLAHTPVTIFKFLEAFRKANP